MAKKDRNLLHKHYVPQQDITPYEVATVVGLICGTTSPSFRGILFSKDAWELLPEGVKRHFTDNKAV